jgi:drug/metabolite transporter (DMT)-like permease
MPIGVLARQAGRALNADTRRIGLLCLFATVIGWGINWPVVKMLLREWPPFFSRGSAGIAAALAIALLAAIRGERLRVPRRVVPRLLAAAMLNVFVWMGFPTLALLWLSVAETALLVYTMPIWAMLLAWPIQGQRPRPIGLVALAMGLAGLALLLSGGQASAADQDTPWLLGVAISLGAALAFALGTVAWRTPLPLPPLAAVAWQVGLGCLPMVAIGVLFERPALAALSSTGWLAMAYMAVVPMGICYLSWFAALRRLPPTAASTATLLTPVVGVFAAAVTLGEPFGPRQAAALVLTLGGVALALRKT